MTSNEGGGAYKNLGGDGDDIRAGEGGGGVGMDVKSRGGKDSKAPVILGPQWSRSGKSFASGSAGTAASPKASKEKFGSLSKDISASFLSVAGTVDSSTDVNGRPVLGRHDSRGRSRFPDLRGSAGDREDSGTGPNNSGRSLDRGDFSRSFSRGESSHERSEGSAMGGGGPGGSYRSSGRSDSFVESGGRSYAESRTYSRPEMLDRGDDRRYGSSSGADIKEDRRQSLGEGARLTRRPSGRVLRYTREELLDLHAPNLLPKDLPEAPSVILEGSLVPVCTLPFNPEEIYRVWSQSKGRGRGRGRGTVPAGQTLGRRDEGESPFTRRSSRSESRWDGDKLPWEEDDKRAAGRSEDRWERGVKPPPSSSVGGDLWDDVGSAVKAGKEDFDLSDMAAAAAKFRMEVDGMYRDEGINPPVRMVDNEETLDSELNELTFGDDINLSVPSPSLPLERGNQLQTSLTKDDSSSAFPSASSSGAQSSDLKDSYSPAPLDTLLSTSAMDNPLASLLGGGAGRGESLQSLSAISLLDQKPQPLPAEAWEQTAAKALQSALSSSSGSEQWYYTDPRSFVQGPFSYREMREWFEAGYFKPDLPVRRGPIGRFQPLRAVYPNFKDAFLAPPPASPSPVALHQPSPLSSFGFPQTQTDPSKQREEILKALGILGTGTGAGSDQQTFEQSSTLGSRSGLPLEGPSILKQTLSALSPERVHQASEEPYESSPLQDNPLKALMGEARTARPQSPQHHAAPFLQERREEEQPVERKEKDLPQKQKSPKRERREEGLLPVPTSAPLVTAKGWAKPELPRPKSLKEIQSEEAAEKQGEGGADAVVEPQVQTAPLAQAARRPSAQAAPASPQPAKNSPQKAGKNQSASSGKQERPAERRPSAWSSRTGPTKSLKEIQEEEAAAAAAKEKEEREREKERERERAIQSQKEQSDAKSGFNVVKEVRAKSLREIQQEEEEEAERQRKEAAERNKREAALAAAQGRAQPMSATPWGRGPATSPSLREIQAQEAASSSAQSNNLTDMASQLKMMLGVGASAAPAQTSASAWGGGARPQAPAKSMRDILAEQERSIQAQAAASSSTGRWAAMARGFPPSQGVAKPLAHAPPASAAKQDPQAKQAADDGDDEDALFWGSSSASKVKQKPTPAPLKSQSESRPTGPQNSIGRAQIPGTKGPVTANRPGGEREKEKQGEAGAAAFGASVPEELESWCKQQFKRLTGSDDITLIHFCMSLDDASEIREYLATYLGSKPEVSAFASEFIRRKNDGKGWQEVPIKSSGAAASAAGGAKQAAKGKGAKKKKGVKVDPSLLGYNVSSGVRINAGELEFPE